jgi:hypothetical protein
LNASWSAPASTAGRFALESHAAEIQIHLVEVARKIDAEPVCH